MGTRTVTDWILDWAKFESFIGQSVPLNVKTFLELAGYDSFFSVKRIDEEKIHTLEKHVQNNRGILKALDEKDKTTFLYRSQNVFNFLPGHKTILLALPELIGNMFDSIDTLCEPEAETSFNLPDLNSMILSKLIKSAIINKDRSKNAYQYDEIIKDFSTYIFLLCGRTCYETLNKNLPIPSTKSIREYYLDDFISFF